MRDKLSKYINNILNVSYGADLFFMHNCPSVPEQSDRYIPILQTKTAFSEKKNLRPYGNADTKTPHWNTIETSSNGSPFQVSKISDQRRDIIAYTHSYHWTHGSSPIREGVWSNRNIRSLLLHERFDAHHHLHRPSCFKKNKECRFLYPVNSSSITHIDVDEGDEDQNFRTVHSY
eukprot:scaffold77192_cov37-Cyclotella_meneghiniana.AAC.4